MVSDGVGNKPGAGLSVGGNKTPMARDVEPALPSPQVRIPVVRIYRRTMIRGFNTGTKTTTLMLRTPPNMNTSRVNMFIRERTAFPPGHQPSAEQMERKDPHERPHIRVRRTPTANQQEEGAAPKRVPLLSWDHPTVFK
ncbi:unnamed protein product [Arctogadus glacialis]